MIKIERDDVYGWEAAIRGLRNPMNSHDKSDSDWEFVEDPSIINPNDEVKFVAGKNDLELMKKLVKAGTDHSKFMRMINVTVDITAPLYWWKEFDTYKVGTVANSCSTMHTIHKKEFVLGDFSWEKLNTHMGQDAFSYIVDALNNARELYLECTVSKYANVEECREKKKQFFDEIIQLLPSSYNQKRTVQMNYQVLRNIYHARKNHKLDEWRDLCKWIESLPYSELITEE